MRLSKLLLSSIVLLNLTIIISSCNRGDRQDLLSISIVSLNEFSIGFSSNREEINLTAYQNKNTIIGQYIKSNYGNLGFVEIVIENDEFFLICDVNKEIKVRATIWCLFDSENGQKVTVVKKGKYHIQNCAS